MIMASRALVAAADTHPLGLVLKSSPLIRGRYSWELDAAGIAIGAA